MQEPAIPAAGVASRPADAEEARTDRLFCACYRDLRRLAHARLAAGGRDVLLDTTVLVHESYMRLSQMSGLAFPDRARFLAYAGRVMRSIIVDEARRRLAGRHGGNATQVTLDTQFDAPADTSAAHEIVCVHDALSELAQFDPRMARVVELKYFGGLTEAEIATGLGIADRTVRRDWEQARLILAQALQPQ